MEQRRGAVSARAGRWAHLAMAHRQACLAQRARPPKIPSSGNGKLGVWHQNDKRDTPECRRDRAPPIVGDTLNRGHSAQFNWAGYPFPESTPRCDVKVIHHSTTCANGVTANDVSQLQDCAFILGRQSWLYTRVRHKTLFTFVPEGVFVTLPKSLAAVLEPIFCAITLEIDPTLLDEASISRDACL